MSGATKSPAIMIRKISLIWYPLTLVQILALVAAGFAGWLPSLVGLLGLFLLFFWVFSLGFALLTRLKPPKEPRQ